MHVTIEIVKVEMVKVCVCVCVPVVNKLLKQHIVISQQVGVLVLRPSLQFSCVSPGITKTRPRCDSVKLL